MSDVARAVAFVFRRKGAEVLSERDFVHVLSFDLRWLAPPEARRLLALAAERGLVAREGEEIRPAFAHASLDVPIGWRATPAALDEPAVAPPGAPPQDDLAARLAALANVQPDALRREAEHERERAAGLLTTEAATLLAAARRGADVREVARSTLRG